MLRSCVGSCPSGTPITPSAPFSSAEARSRGPGQEAGIDHVAQHRFDALAE